MSTATPPIPAWLFRALERLGEPSRGGPRRAGLGGQVTAAAMLLLFALPGSLVGIAMIRFWNRDAAPRCFHALYDSGLMLPLGLAAVHLPLAWLLLHGRLRATPAVLGEVERLQPLAPGRRWLELSAPRLAVAGALAAGLV
ncbi:MAG TPA: hypothetical protein PLG73_05110, partial [Candidatus Sumerlaeota bacterium]|nr:hypothetical protein [Candidatus Sumerlaeota bacterium]